MTRPDLDAIKARLAAATSGPWAYHHAEAGRLGPRYVLHGAGSKQDAPWIANVNIDTQDAPLIANAPTDLAALMVYIEELEKRAPPAASDPDALTKAQVFEFLLQAQGQIAQAALAAGLDYHTFVRVMKRHRLDYKTFRPKATRKL